MIKANRGQVYSFKFIFVRNGQLYNPTSLETPVDVKVTVYRGEFGSGSIIDGPYSYLNQAATPDSETRIEVSAAGEYTFYYKVPDRLFEGTYSVIASTSDELGVLTINSNFQVLGSPTTLSPVVISKNSSAVVNYKPSYSQLNSSNTSTILLIGHADGIQLNEPVRITDIQSAIDLLNADLSSPLLRGVFDAFAAGARDIMICAAAPMSEYVRDFSNRLTPTTVFEIDQATPGSKTFYEKYYERLEQTYPYLLNLDFVDIIVPLETSIIRTGGVDFVSQLAEHCSNFHNFTGYVQLGFIGSVSGGMSSDDVQEILSNSSLVNKMTTYLPNGLIANDPGRFVVPIYGEAVFSHPQLFTPYTSSAAASFAGMAASMPLASAIIRKRVPGMMHLHGSDLSQEQYKVLEDNGINALYKGKQTRYSTPYQVYITNEYTLAAPNSTLSKLAQMRLIARVVSEIRSFAIDSIGKFGYDKVRDNTISLLDSYRSSNAIVDYSVRIEPVSGSRGSLIFYIELLSALGLKKIDFSLSAGPVV